MTTTDKEERSAERSMWSGTSGMIVGACTLIGVGIGKIIGDTSSGTIIGMGVGLLAAVLIQLVREQKH